MLMIGHAEMLAFRRDTHNRRFAPSEPTCCTSEMSINKFIAASLVCKRST